MRGIRSVFAFFVPLAVIGSLVVPPVAHAAPTLKDYVFRVRTTYAPEVLRDLEGWARVMDSLKLPEVATRFRAIASGSGGSGWLYNSYQGKDFIVTNAHVVASASGCVIEREMPGLSGRFEEVGGGCRILFVDGLHDVAILAPQRAIGLAGGLEILPRDARLSSGTTIWASGFPAGTGTQLWNFTQGQVSNGQVPGGAPVFRELGVELDFLIAHGATIDHGNSGGPLLANRYRTGACSEAAPGNCLVVGLNTYGISKQYYSIPSQYVLDALAEAGRRQAAMAQRPQRIDLLKKQIRIFSSEVRKAKTDSSDFMRMAVRLSNMISYSYVGRYGSSMLLNSLDKMPQDERKDALRRMVNDPVQSMTFWAILDLMSRVAQFGDLSSMRFNPDTDLAEGDMEAVMDRQPRIQCTLQTARGPLDLIWGIEYGDWKIVDQKISSQAPGGLVENTGTSNAASATGAQPTRYNEPYKNGRVFNAIMDRVRSRQ